MKKIVLVLTLGFVSLFIAGCSANGSPTKVAKEMVKRLAKEDYANIEKIFYQEEGGIFDEEKFKALVEKNDLNIKGNKKIEVREEGAEITNADGFVTSKIKIAIDNNKLFTIDTIQVDGKWYVYEPDFYDSDITIVVPKGATVKIDDEKLGKEYKEKKKISLTAKHPSSSYVSVKMNDIEVDAYVLKSPLKGSYSITVEGESTIKDVIMTYSDRYSISSTNYTYESSSTDGMIYMFDNSEETSNEKIEKFISEYMNAVSTEANTRSGFSAISKYFDLDTEDYDAEDAYDDMIYDNGDPNKVTSSTNIYYNNFKITNIEYKGFKTYNDNNIVVKFTYTLSYKYNKKYSDGDIYNKDYSYKYHAIAVLSKDGNTYKIKNGYNLFVTD